MRFSMISWIIRIMPSTFADSPNLSPADNTDTMSDSKYDIRQKPNSIIVLLYIRQSAKEDTSLRVC